MQYIKIADTEHGELGHNGWTWVLNNPYDADDKEHPAYYEETGVLTVSRYRGRRDYQVNFRPIACSRGGLSRSDDLWIPVTDEQAAVGIANRRAYNAARGNPVYKVITD